MGNSALRETCNFYFSRVFLLVLIKFHFGWETRIYNQFHNILRLFNVLQIFLPPQVKQWAIITYKHGIHELSHELPNNLRLIRKVSKLHIMIASPAKTKILLILAKNSRKIMIKLFPWCAPSHEK